MKPIKICIVGLKCHDHVTGAEVPRYLGGIETQLAVLAKGLAAQGCEVSMIVYDHGQDEGGEYGGVRVLKAYAPEGGIRGVRNIHPRATRLWSAMRRADADVYLQMGAGFETWLVARGCRSMPGGRRKFVFCLASDADLAAHYFSGTFGWEGRLYRRSLRSADCIIAQTEDQRAKLMETMGLESVIIPMAVAVPDMPTESVDQERLRILWVGRIMPTKRLELLLELARNRPADHFDVVGTPNQDSEYASGLMREATSLTNVTVHGRVSVEHLNGLYSQCRVLCCTSELEGFPTTFLEAWSRGIPVLTTIDPDDTIARNGAGGVCSDVDELGEWLDMIGSSPEVYERACRAATSFYQANHSVESVTGRFRGIFDNVITLWSAPVVRESGVH